MGSTHARATVIAFAPKRRAARANGRRRAVARGLVAAWFGMAALAVLLLLGQGVALMLRHGVAGIGIGLVAVSAASWPVAGRLLVTGSSGPRKRPISRRHGAFRLKLSPLVAETHKEEI
jgi:hypothetical protein